MNSKIRFVYIKKPAEFYTDFIAVGFQKFSMYTVKVRGSKFLPAIMKVSKLLFPLTFRSVTFGEKMP
jgi:hypothetical protein